jgi:CheY-like chemotaxis protein
VSIQIQQGHVSLFINKQVLMRSRLEDELISIVKTISGVQSVEIQVDGGESSEQIYRKRSAKLPSRVLLVDDEQEFVQTLSERLQLRGIGSAVAFDGQSALHLVNEDEPEVMILDLKMPGIDGMDLLQRVKSIRPEIEIIILTGHGNNKDREKSLQLGAFAYMQKPVDIDQLSTILKNAHERIRQTP